jgi:hypothetical protein
MKANVFTCHGEGSPDKQQYMKTVGVLAEHINKTFSYPQDVASICKSFKIVSLVQPANLTKEAYEQDMGARMIWETSMKTYMKRKDLMDSNAIAIYAIVWGQCSPMMQSKLESLEGFESKSTSCDCIWLLKEIQGITHRFEGTRNVFISLNDAWSDFYAYKQGQHQQLYDYLKEFQSLVQVLEHYGAEFGADGPNQESVMAEVKIEFPNLSDTGLRMRAVLAAKRKSIAIAFLKNADRTKYGGLWADLENQFTRGSDQYPTEIIAAYNLLMNFKAPPRQFQRQERQRQPIQDDTESTSGISALTFLHSTPVAGTDGVTHPTVECFDCHDKGHYANLCPSRQEVTLLNVETEPPQDIQEVETIQDEEPYQSAFTFVGVDYNFHQGSNIIPDSWILLDSQSTVSVFKNRRLLTDIRDAKEPLQVYTNGGIQTNSQVGRVRNFGDVWYNPESLANILSMSAVSKVCRITMDTSVVNALHVHRTDGTIMTFKEYKSGLYYYDAASVSNDHSSAQVTAYMFINTVASLKAQYSRREIEGAEEARKLSRLIGDPTEAHYNDILQNNRVRNCPITADDAKRALHIWGPSVHTLEGKMVKQQNKGIPNYHPVLIPAPIVDKYKHIRLFMDIFWVNGSPYFHTISEHIKFRTVAWITNRQKRTLLMEAKAIINMYEARGFVITRVEADREFACITNDILPTVLNIADADDHVSEAERSIRTIKERVRCTVQGLPYRRIPKVMMRAVVEGAHKSLNQFPARNGASDELSPLTIMTGTPSPDYHDFKIELGAYAHVFEDNNPTNTNKTRSTGAIALTQTGNAQGGYYFMSLTTGKRLSRQQWTALPIPDGVIATVEAMAEAEEQPLMGNGGPEFEWSQGIPILDEDHVPIMVHDVDEAVEEAQEEIVMDDHEEEEDHEVDLEQNGEALEDDEEIAQEPENEPYEEANDEPALSEESGDDGSGTPDDEDESDPPDLEPPPRYNLRANRERTYDNRLAHSMDNPESSKSYDVQFLQHGASPHQGRGDAESDTSGSYDPEFLKQGAAVKPTLRETVEVFKASGSKAEVHNYITDFIMTQMTAKAGIKKHGKVAIDALYTEFLQLHDLGVFQGEQASALTKEQKKAALRAISVIKEKRNGVIKGRTVADGSTQRSMYTKDETSSPTVSTDALMSSIMIDAYERRDVATADVAGAYLHASMDDFTLLKVEGESVDIMCDVCKEYEEFVTYENGKRVLYLRLLKALYGCVKSALLWYELFTGTLVEMGFELNPYDACVANKVVDGKQCTIVWYVDDNKISHVDSKVNTEVIQRIEERFGKMTVTRGKKHVFLGMEIEYLENGTASIDMSEYLREGIQEFPEVINSSAATPARRDMYEIDEKSKLLDPKRSAIFHSIVAKNLYVSHRGRLDVQLPIAFLCTRVSCSTEQDWKKLRRVLEYLNGTLDDKRYIGADSLLQMKTWVDASYAVHADMKSHTGGVVSFGTGALMGKSSKQKLNTKSSTEAELVGASDYLPHAIWARKFMEKQGYPITHNIFYQDNESAIRFEKNGRKSCGPNSRHIDIRYFFIKDRLETDGFTVEHCPTEQMLADFFTKPLQGNLFRRLREVIMGREHTDTLKEIVSAKSQERVEESLLEKKSETTADQPRTDSHTCNKGQPQKGPVTYADAVKMNRPQHQEKTEESKEKRGASMMLTLKK